MKDKRTPLILLAVCFLGLALAACGQRGPLYLPDEGDATVVPQVDEEKERDEQEDS